MPFDPEHYERARTGELDLSHCDFEKAELVGMDLRHRRFSGSRLVSTSFSGSDLRGAILKDTAIISCDFSNVDMSASDYTQINLNGCNFSGANLRGAVFSGSIFNQIDLSGADLRDADFSGAQFHGTTNLDGIKFNENTNLEGVSGLRSLAKSKMFDNYVFSDGIYTRKLKSIDFFSNGDIVFNEVRSEPNGRVSRSIDINADQIKFLSASMSILIAEKIDELSEKKPNGEIELEQFEENIKFLQSISDGLVKISKLLDDMSREDRYDRVRKASAIVVNLSDAVEGYLKSDGKKVVSVGLIALASGLFYLCGAPGTLGFLTAATLVGGSDVVLAASKALSGLKSPPEK